MRVGVKLDLFEPYKINAFFVKEFRNVLFCCFHSLFYIHCVPPFFIPGGSLAVGSDQDAIGDRYNLTAYVVDADDFIDAPL